MRFFGKTQIDFIGLRRKAFLLSGIIIAIGITSIAVSYTHLTLPTSDLV